MSSMLFYAYSRLNAFKSYHGVICLYLMDKYNYLDVNVSKQEGGGDDIVNIILKARVSFMKLKLV